MADHVGIVRLKPARKEDAVILAGICKRAFETDVEVGAPGEKGGPPGYDSPESQVRLMSFLHYYKILADDGIVGGIIVGSVRDEYKVLERIFVDPKFHRKGIGARAFELLWELYPNVKLWTLGTPEWNVRTRNFYEKLGFVQVGWEPAKDPNWRGRWYQRVMDPSDPYETLKIGELRGGMKNVLVEGEIMEKSAAREVRSWKKEKTLTVTNATIEDETGKAVLVLWNEQIEWVKAGDSVRIENGYVSSYRGVIQLNVGRIGRLIVLI